MSEAVVGVVYILNGAGEAQRDVCVPVGSHVVIEGELGSLVVDALVSPPRLTGKGNVYIAKESEQVRSYRMVADVPVSVVLFNGFPIGSVTFKSS